MKGTSVGKEENFYWLFKSGCPGMPTKLVVKHDASKLPKPKSANSEVRLVAALAFFALLSSHLSSHYVILASQAFYLLEPKSTVSSDLCLISAYQFTVLYARHAFALPFTREHVECERQSFGSPTAQASASPVSVEGQDKVMRRRATQHEMLRRQPSLA